MLIEKQGQTLCVRPSKQDEIRAIFLNSNSELKLYWHRNPSWLQAFYPSRVWQKPSGEKKLYLTFDDGPIPSVTEWVLEVLQQHEAKATFFCVGDNIRKHPAVFEKVLMAGHSVGNHTFNHLNGWKTELSEYLQNVELCQQYLSNQSRLFRPPYGRITRAAAARLRADTYSIVMWDVLSGDFDTQLTPEKCLKNSIQATRDGSVIVFHDSLKARPNLEYTLPRYLAHFQKQGFAFVAL